MGNSPQWPYGGPPPGQPAPLDTSQPPDTLGPPLIFGQRYAQQAGKPKAISVAQPAAGVDWSYKQTGPSWALLRAFLATLACSAAAGNRAAAFTLTLNGIKVAAFQSPLAEIANQSFVYNATACSSTSTTGLYVAVQLPDLIVLSDNMVLSSETNGLLAGDQWSSIALLVEEFDTFDWWDE
jgi:hypothetical protein